MRKLIWRPRAVSRRALVLVAISAVAGVFMAERVKVTHERPHFELKRKAAELAEQAMIAVKDERVRRGYPIDVSVDPAKSGLIGLSHSEVTSIAGNLASKQTSINPNFAAVVLEMLKDLDVHEGDKVAVGVSGSFPALNVCVFAALQTLKAEPIIIASGAASQWGANFDEFLWIDMEKELFDGGFFSFTSVAASMGGYEDRGLGMSPTGKRKVRESIERNNLVFLNDETFEQSIESRMAIYREKAGNQPIRAYINVGGGTVSVGRSLGKKLFHPGINRRLPSGAGLVDGVMPRFVKDGIPVIHLIQILEMAERFRFEIQPTRLPDIGVGDIFKGTDYSRPLVSTVLCVLVGALFAFIRSDVGFRLFKGSGKTKDEGHPEPMV